MRELLKEVIKFRADIFKASISRNSSYFPLFDRSKFVYDFI